MLYAIAMGQIMIHRIATSRRHHHCWSPSLYCAVMPVFSWHCTLITLRPQGLRNSFAILAMLKYLIDIDIDIMQSLCGWWCWQGYRRKLHSSFSARTKRTPTNVSLITVCCVCISLRVTKLICSLWLKKRGVEFLQWIYPILKLFSLLETAMNYLQSSEDQTWFGLVIKFRSDSDKFANPSLQYLQGQVSAKFGLIVITRMATVTIVHIQTYISPSGMGAHIFFQECTSFLALKTQVLTVTANAQNALQHFRGQVPPCPSHACGRLCRPV